jgi:hypothetical protein
MYFLTMLVVNAIMIGCVIYYVPHITANSLFFGAVKLVEAATSVLENVLNQLVIVVGIWLVFTFRKKDSCAPGL